MASSQIPAPSSTFGGNGGPQVKRSSSLVRSKSLRLPSATRKPAEVPGSPSSLTRHGSMRVSRTQNSIPASLSAATLSSSMKQNLKKPPPPPVKPKPTFVSADKMRQPEDKNECDLNKSGSPQNQPSMPLDVGHWRRLTEEHEKLQMDYARLRMQHMDNAASKLMSASQFGTRKDPNTLHTAYSDTHLDTIPEDGPSSLSKLQGVFSEEKQQYMEEYVQQLESLVQGYRAEVLRVQEESRKTQRKYWDIAISHQVSESPSSESSKEISLLLDKLEEKQNDVNQLNSKVQTLSGQLASTHEELQKCHNALQDYQYQIESGEHERTELEKRLRDLRGDLCEAKESVEFLQAERTTLAETLHETEQVLHKCRAQWEKDKCTFQDVARKHRKLYTKVQDKNLQLQILQAELEATEGRARDMLLSQGAQLTLGAVSVSQLTSRINTVLSSILDYAAVDLGLEKEVNGEIIGDGDDLCQESKIWKRVRLPSEDEEPKVLNGTVTSSEEPSPTLELPPSEPRSRSTSLVQSIIQALEQSSRNSTTNNSGCNSPTKLLPSRPNCTDPEPTIKDPLPIARTKDPPSDVKNVEGCSGGGSPSRPVGMATAFRSKARSSEEDLPEEASSLDCQARQANVMLNKLVAVLDLIQKTYSEHIQERDLKIVGLECELQQTYESKSRLKSDFEERCSALDEERSKVAVLVLDSAAIKEKQVLDNTNHQEEVAKLRTKIRSLEAINAEQARQMKEEVFRLVRTAGPANSAVGDAMAICDKLVLRQEITKLKEMLKEKEDLLKQLGGKFTRHKKVWEGNLQKAEGEVARLDDIIDRIIMVLQDLPEVVQGCEPLSLLVEQLKSGSAYIYNGSGTASMEGSLIMTSSTDLV